MLRNAASDRRIWGVLIVFVCVPALALAASVRPGPPAHSGLVAKLADCATRGDGLQRVITCEARALTPAFRQRGVAEGVRTVSRVANDRRLAVFRGTCHRALHEVAASYARVRRLTLAKLNGLLAPAYGPGCPSGFNHGLIIYAAPQLDPSDPIGAERRLCSRIGHRFGRAACVHGLGHAFLVIWDGDRARSLSSCRRLGRVSAPDCADAVFHGTALDIGEHPPPPPRVRCRDQRGAFAEVCWRRAWSAVLEHQQYLRKPPRARAWLARCRLQPAASRAGCVTTLARHRPGSPLTGVGWCAALDPAVQVACLKGLVVSAIAPGNRGSQVRLVARCNALTGARRTACSEVLGRNLNVLTNGDFARTGCGALASSRDRRGCRRGARRFREALVTYG